MNNLNAAYMFQTQVEGFDLHSYNRYVCAFSSGKDSTALVLYLLLHGVPANRIELWHHEIDGREGNKLMDWNVTSAYVQAFGDAFGIPVYYSWKEGGFEQEMTRNNSLTAPTIFQDENYNLVKVGGTRGKLNTRMVFPQVSPDLSVRWCSSYLKIDIGACALRNQNRFQNSRTLVLSGERGEESSARAKYAILEPDRADARQSRLKRHIDRFRPIKDWTEKMVWDIIQHFKVRVHPAYYMGWGRVSCLFCIFGNANQFASAAKVSPCGIKRIIAYEKAFGKTIKRKISVEELIEKGNPYEAITQELIDMANSDVYLPNIIMSKYEDWILPAGAYGESCGPM